MNNQIQFIRTPDDAFKNLEDYPYTENYMVLEGGVRMHYVEEGKGNEKTIFLLHGQPSWSYLYRHMIKYFVEAGYHVIAPDLIGFGKSDKPVDPKYHTYTNHVLWMSEFVQNLGINNAISFMQDWGGLIGLRVLAEQPEWLNRLVVSNTALAEVKGIGKYLYPVAMKLMTTLSSNPTIEKFASNKTFGNWSGYFAKAKQPNIGLIMQILTNRSLSQPEMNAYNAPFLDQQFMAGPRTMPQIIATDINEVNDAWKKLKKWEKPVLTLFSDNDPFLAGKGYDTQFQTNFKGAKGQPHITISNASHFLQEDQAKVLVENILNWEEVLQTHSIL
ncbi:haloalkane dehalogenase [Flammeovirga agarivorans]|uniref:Alpha/beta fold hydrolase n=1 Tax=Flammeovirga agarivorans TaxID=2726742 RepID=A0A7X8SKB5_9BACT|nr:haloalkane dehalogenase [Flammeovirga agarivorans]NLR91830.1 alpha/beta fold hydrolase [Flammeovirga agarivorans]